MLEITKHIIEAYTIHRELLEQEHQKELDAQNDNPDKVCYHELKYANGGQSRPLQIDSSVKY